MTEARKNIIVSHGGKHGPTSATFLRGQRIDPEVAPHVPKGLKTESDPGSPFTPIAAPAPKPAVAVATPAGPPISDPADPPAPPKAETAQTLATPPATGDAPKGDVKPPATTPPAAPAPAPRGKRSGNVPSTRKGVTKLERTQAVSLARDLGIEFSDETPLEEIHERLVKALSIE